MFDQSECRLKSKLTLFVANDYDRYGKQCPLFAHDNVACPMICVTNQNLCPTALAATCPEGLTFCGDGTCQQSCADIANACQCGDDTVQYFPCAAGQLVNITHFDPVNQVAQIQNTCAASANISGASIGAWGDFNTSSLWLSCPIVETTFTYTEPMWIGVWALMGAEAAILALWAIYKSLREARFHRSVSSRLKSTTDNSNSTSQQEQTAIRVNSQIDESECKMDVSSTAAAAKGSSDEKSIYTDEKAQDKYSNSTVASDSIKESEKLKFRGFLNDYFGMFGFASCVITTLLFFVFLGSLVGDYCK